MGLKTRLNKLEQNIKPNGNDPKKGWLNRMKKHEELDSLYPAVLQGDLKACIRYCNLLGEKELDSLYNYRDTFIQIVEGKGHKVDYSQFREFDVWYKNLKTTYRYLEAKAADPEAKEPVLTAYKSPGQ